MKPQRLDKVISHLQCQTRKEVTRLIKSGWVEVGGETIRQPAYKFDPTETTVSINGQPLIWQKHFHVMIHKPQGCVCANSDPRELVVVDLVPPELYRPEFSIVGRLDKNTEGLLLLTTDGTLLHRLTHPRWHLRKRYYVELENPVTSQDVEAFAKEMTVEGETWKPAELIPKEDPQQVELIVYEGKFHQVKRMFAARGNQVTYLKRIQMGPVELDPELEVGEVRSLYPEEVKALYESVGLEPE
ncbi:pseudouridine synthase [Geitlerinema sp. PCC 9228]|jgi:16S rRNA pseudouridine516 synthase|uniref:pseudouridine synthase n=1 Tax=Geitlerinema sp. PCC 9228 TaxID=111611 RepID=UPI0008F98C24|nr:pseudouridine synthase [Geitlerinema sp. PCC 9228]